MFGDCLHCIDTQCSITTITTTTLPFHTPVLQEQPFWAERGKMDHYVKDSLGTERNSGQSCTDGGQLVHNGGQQVSLEIHLAGAQGAQHASELWKHETLTLLSFCSLKGMLDKKKTMSFLYMGSSPVILCLVK